MEKPNLNEDLDYEVLLDHKITRMTRAYQREQPDYQRPTVVDPVYHALAEVTYTDLTLKHRINYVGLQSLLAYTDELDFILKGKRRDGESMEDFRVRVRQDIASASSAGSLVMYSSLAESAGNLEGVQVKNARAIVEEDKVVIYLQSTDPSPENDTLLINAVSEYLNREDVKPALDLVEVRMATAVSVDIEAIFELESGATLDLVEKIKNELRAEWEKKSDLSWNPSLSWIISRMQKEGVYAVELSSPSHNIELEPFQYPVIGTINFIVRS